MSANTSYTIKMLEARITLAKGGFRRSTITVCRRCCIRAHICPARAVD